MSKTNHRINKDRTEKLNEAKAHKQRRGFKVKANELVDLYEDDPDSLYDEFYGEDTFETYQKIKRT